MLERNGNDKFISRKLEVSLIKCVGERVSGSIGRQISVQQSILDQAVRARVAGGSHVGPMGRRHGRSVRRMTLHQCVGRLTRGAMEWVGPLVSGTG